jgi:hypothetical protein
VAAVGVAAESAFMTAHRVLVLSAAGLLAAACTVDPAPAPAPYVAPAPPGGQAEAADIDTGATIEAQAGQGAGVFVEYLGQGDWHVWTTCDTAVKGLDCHYTLFLTPYGSSVREVYEEPVDTSRGNSVQSYATHVEARFHTTYEADGVHVIIDPGAALEVSFSLDGDPDPRVLFWNDAEVLHTGAPSNPMAFYPTSP